MRVKWLFTFLSFFILAFAISPIIAQVSSAQSGLEVLLEITTGDGPLNDPTSVSVDSHGNIFVVDGGNNRIQVFDKDGEYLRGWGALGKGQGEFDLIDPREGIAFGEIAIDANDNIYVADTFNARVQKFDNEGNFLLEWGSKGRDDGQFTRTTSVAVSPDGNIYVVDDRRNIVQVFDAQGNFLFRFADRGDKPGQLSDTGLITIDSDGNAYIADYGNNRVQKFDSDGTFMTMWGSTGNEHGEFVNPIGISTDSQGRVFVAEYGGKRLQMFDSEGTFLAAWSEADETKFGNLLDIAVDADGFLYVVDNSSARILKLQMVE